MSSRRVSWAVAAAATLTLTLTGCNNDTGPDAPDAATPAASALAATPPEVVPTATATATPTVAAGKPAAGGKTTAAAPAESQKDGCGDTAKPLPAGHRNILPTTRSTATTLSATDARLECTQPDYGWWPNGAEKAYTFAAGAKAQESVDLEPVTVPVAKLTERIVRCADTAADHLGCGSGAYEITLDPAGRITAIREYGDY